MSATSPRSATSTHDRLVALPIIIDLGDDLILQARPRAADRTDPRGCVWLVGWRADALIADPDPGQTSKRARRLLSARYPNGGTASILPEPVAGKLRSEKHGMQREC